MRQRTSQILYAYWNEVRGERLAPRRLEIEPSRIATILPETFVLERGPAATYTFRLAGTRLFEAFGHEFRGTDFLAGWSPNDRTTLVRQLDVVCSQGAALVLLFEAATAASGKCAEFEAVLLPLLHTAGDVTRLLGAISPLAAPPWLGHERLEGQRLLGHELIWPDGRPYTIAEKMREQTPLKSALSGARLVRFDRRSFRVLDGGLGRK